MAVKVIRPFVPSTILVEDGTNALKFHAPECYDAGMALEARIGSGAQWGTRDVFLIRGDVEALAQALKDWLRETARGALSAEGGAA